MIKTGPFVILSKGPVFSEIRCTAVSPAELYMQLAAC